MSSDVPGPNLLFFGKVKKIYKNKKIKIKTTGASFILTSNMCAQRAWMDVAGLQEEEEEGGAGKQMKAGWGLTGVHVGIWGWATVEHPPRYCLLCQAESVFFSKKPELICQPQQTLSISTGLTPHPHLL